MIDRLFNGTYSATKAMHVGICNKLVNLMKVSTQIPSTVIVSHRPSRGPDIPKHKVPSSIKSRGFGKAPVKPHCGVLIDPQHCLNKQFRCDWLPCCGGCSLFTIEECCADKCSAERPLLVAASVLATGRLPETHLISPSYLRTGHNHCRQLTPDCSANRFDIRMLNYFWRFLNCVSYITSNTGACG